MNRVEQQNAEHIMALAKSCLAKLDWEHEKTWEGFCLSAHQAGGRSWRPDPIAGKVDRIHRERIEPLEAKAWKLVSALPDVQFDCAFVWYLIKDQVKPNTQNRYRLSDLLAVLTWKYFSKISVQCGHSFQKDIWKSLQTQALQGLAANYGKLQIAPEQISLQSRAVI